MKGHYPSTLKKLVDSMSLDEVLELRGELYEYRLLMFEMLFKGVVVPPFDIEHVEVIHKMLTTRTEPIVRREYDYLLKVLIDYELKEKRKFDLNPHVKVLEKLDLGYTEFGKFVLEKPTHLLFLMRALRPVDNVIVKPDHTIKREYWDEDYLPTAHTLIKMLTKNYDYISNYIHLYCYRDFPRNVEPVEMAPRSFVFCFKHFKTTRRLKKPSLALGYVDSIFNISSLYDSEKCLIPMLSKRGFEFTSRWKRIP